MGAADYFRHALKQALQPLLDRAGRRVARVKHLRAQPAADQAAKAIAAEQEEIKLVQGVAQGIGEVFAEITELLDVQRDHQAAILQPLRQARADAERNLRVFWPMVLATEFEWPTSPDPERQRYYDFVQRRQQRMNALAAKHPHGLPALPKDWEQHLHHHRSAA